MSREVTLWQALIVSFVLHVGWLWPSIPLLQREVTTPAPLRARLQQPPVNPAVAVPRTVAPEKQVVTEPVAAINPPASPVVMSEGLDANDLRQLQVSLARQAARFKRYPSQALASGWKGVVDIRLIFQSVGVGSEIVRSSGVAVLDEAALDMLRQAASRVVIPESLRGRNFAVELPVVFD